jgi:GTPase SAR1 family protein
VWIQRLKNKGRSFVLIRKKMLWFNVILLGDSGVGKSSLIQRLTEDTYSSTFLATVGVDLKRKTFVELNTGLQVSTNTNTKKIGWIQDSRSRNSFFA